MTLAEAGWRVELDTPHSPTLAPVAAWMTDQDGTMFPVPASDIDGTPRPAETCGCRAGLRVIPPGADTSSERDT